MKVTCVALHPNRTVCLGNVRRISVADGEEGHQIQPLFNGILPTLTGISELLKPSTADRGLPKLLYRGLIEV